MIFIIEQNQLITDYCYFLLLYLVAAPVFSFLRVFSPPFVRYSLTELGMALAERLESGERGGDDGQELEKMSQAEDSGDGPVTVDLTVDEGKEEHKSEDSW